jgi:uncharacterized protein YcgI (DUF1989 family)
MNIAREIVIAKRKGISFTVKTGQHIRVIDVEGGQVADFVAFKENDIAEKLSTAATIDNNRSIVVGEGDTLFSNRYNPMLEIIDDRVGRHDLLFPACSPWMYRSQYGITEKHPSCLENFKKALEAYGISKNDIPNPFNIFMNAEVAIDGRISIHEPVSTPGDYIELAALMDLIIAVSACPVEESACNAGKCSPIRVELHCK